MELDPVGCVRLSTLLWEPLGTHVEHVEQKIRESRPICSMCEIVVPIATPKRRSKKQKNPTEIVVLVVEFSWICLYVFLYYVCLIDGKCRSMEHDIVPMIGTLLIGSWVILTGLFPRIEPWVLRVLGSNIPMICHSLNKTKSSYSWFYLFCSSLMGTRQKKYGWIWLIAYASGRCSYETSLEWWELHRGMV